uniref:ATP-dependent DNA helicase n=1 Tax=Tetradesmus obliquus TaxID=3088 RepID=A0A383VR27_TETOB
MWMAGWPQHKVVRVVLLLGKVCGIPVTKHGSSASVHRQAFMPIGRMYSVHPSAGERFYLWLLLCHVHGATSFEDLRRVPGHEQPFPTFKEACAARGLLQHDGEWRQCLQEAAGHRMPYCMRGMFASILAYNDVADAAALWNDYKGALCEDLLRTARREHPARQLDEEIEQQCLWILDGLLRQMGKSVADISGMPALQQQFAPQQGIVAQQLRRYPVQQQQARRDAMLPQLNAAQRAVYDAVMRSVQGGGEDSNTAFFVYGLGGAGKTFLYESLLCAVRAEGKVALATASSGIAALLLPGGRTAHSTFKIPVARLHAQSTCNVSA